MKQNEIPDFDIEKLTAQNLENIFNVYQDDNENYYYNVLKSVSFPEDLDPLVYTEYVTQPKDTWPLIAWNFYRDVKLWWIICAVNQIANPVGQPKPGTKLKILSNSIVRDVLVQIKES